MGTTKKIEDTLDSLVKEWAADDALYGLHMMASDFGTSDDRVREWLLGWIHRHERSTRGFFDFADTRDNRDLRLRTGLFINRERAEKKKQKDKNCYTCDWSAMDMDMDPYCTHAVVEKDHPYGLVISRAVERYCTSELKLWQIRRPRTV